MMDLPMVLQSLPDVRTHYHGKHAITYVQMQASVHAK